MLDSKVALVTGSASGIGGPTAPSSTWPRCWKSVAPGFIHTPMVRRLEDDAAQLAR